MTHPPWGGVPVGVVVPLLGAFVTTPLAVVVLASVNGRHPVEVSVGGEESSVPLADATVEVVIIVFMHPVLQVSVAVKVFALCRIRGNGAGEGREGREGVS